MYPGAKPELECTNAPRDGLPTDFSLNAYAAWNLLLRATDLPLVPGSSTFQLPNRTRFYLLIFFIQFLHVLL